MKRLGKLLLSRLPHKPLFDRIHHLAYYLYAHRRLPRRRSGLFNDYLFFLKWDGELAEERRQATSDKLLVKDWIAARIGEDHVPKTLAVLDPEEVSESSIPPHCVAKPTHLSGIVAFVGEAVSPADSAQLRATADRNLYDENREANYRDLEPRIICEEMVAAADAVVDYKIFCFGGEPRIIQVDLDRHGRHTRTLYDSSWRRLKIRYAKPPGPEVARPAQLPRMLDVARKLARDFESVRVDLYVAGNRILVGELTHCPEQGHGRFGTREEERLFSELFFGQFMR